MDTIVPKVDPVFNVRDMNAVVGSHDGARYRPSIPSYPSRLQVRTYGYKRTTTREITNACFVCHVIWGPVGGSSANRYTHKFLA